MNPSPRRLPGARFFFLFAVAVITMMGLVQKFGTFSRASTHAAFTAGNLVVYRVGDGSGSLTAAAAPVFLDEYTPAGALVQSVAMPTAVSGSSKRLTAAGNATSEGFLTRSVDGSYLIVPGYDAAVASSSPATAASSTVNRVIGRVDSAGTIDTTTALTDALSGGNARGATSTNGTDLWISGTASAGGIRYATLGATTSTSLTTAVTNLRATNIFGGQLYVTSASGTTRLVAVGTGTPTTGSQTLNTLTGLDSTTITGPYAFFFADLSAGVAGNDTVYVADEGGNALRKFSLVGGTWTANGSITVTTIRGLTATVSGTTVTLFTENSGTTLGTLTDASGYNATLTGSITSLATAASNTAFRGVALAPGVVTPTPTPTGTPTLTINDVTQAEGNAGTSTFTFTVSLSSPALAGGVTFDIATANGTTNPATAGSDYVAKTLTSQSIAQGNSSYTFDVTVNGDTSPEANETFFVNVTNVSGAIVGDSQGLGTITNDDGTPTLAIHDIQGNGNSSPFTAQVVTTTGVVTGLRTNGFFMQEPDATVDADPNTSEGIFVFTSSAPPAAAALGNKVQVTATVQEFVPSADLYSPPATELITPSVSTISTGNSLPSFHTITAAETLVNDLNNLEKYEGMRVHVDSLTVIAPTQGTVNEANANSTTNGTFYGVITGVARPFREPGIELPDPIPTPTPNPNNIPRWDFNPERLRVDSDAQPGATALEVSTGEVITGITGPLDYGFRTYTILPDPATPPGTSGVGSGTPAPVPTARELMIGTFNMERFFDTTDDAGISDVALTPTAFNNRLNKASLAIRNFMQMPDVIGIEEMENLTTLQAVANKVNSDAVAAAQPNPNYQAYLVEGNDVGGIDVGFLVKSARVAVVDVTQINANETYINPNNNQPELLNDRPPLVLRATIVMPSGVSLPFTVIVVHQRSLGSVDDPTDGNRVRTKRQKQAESLANYIQSRQVANPAENIISVGDYNAFEVNDGYTDVMGTVIGNPAPADQVLLASPDLVNPNLIDLGGLNPGSYSYTFDGDAQSLDHMLVNNNLLGRYSRFAPVHINADLPESFRGDASRPEKISDHDPEVAYFNMAIAPTAANGVISGQITDANGAPVAGAVVNLSGTQNRKFISDGNGNYRFDNVETTGFYTVRPSRVDFSFSPAERSFSQVGNNTEAAFTGSAVPGAVNPLDTPEYFVRQQYLDFLGREPDESGFNFWSDQLLDCGSDLGCVEQKRINVSAAYFLSIEFQATGGLVDSLYRASYGRAPRYADFLPDAASVASGVIVGKPDWFAKLAANKQAFIDAWVQRADFRSAYDGLSDSQYVETLLGHTGVKFSDSERAAFVSSLTNGSTTRAQVLKTIAEDSRFVNAKRNEMFVMMEYFGYLRREPDAPGFQFWLDKLNGFGGNFEQAEMVKAFLVSGEYRDRFQK